MLFSSIVFLFTFFAGCDDLILFVAGKIPECDLIAGESGVLCMGGTGISVSDVTVHIV